MHWGSWKVDLWIKGASAILLCIFVGCVYAFYSNSLDNLCKYRGPVLFVYVPSDARPGAQ